jgi:nitrogen regulatory protein P-II 1
MTKLEAIIQPAKFEAVKNVLSALGIDGMTAMDVRGHGMQKDHTETYRGHEYSLGFLPRIKIDLVLPDDLVDAAVDAIQKTASTGAIGDGKIFLSKVDHAVRIRNQQIGAAAL